MQRVTGIAGVFRQARAPEALGAHACLALAAVIAATACGRAPAPTTSELGGRLEFPGEGVPALTLVLLEAGDSVPRKVRLPAGRARYAVEVPPGRYIVYAIPDDRLDSLLIGAHTEYSPCNARQRRAGGTADGSCRTGPPREVVVAAGARVTDADIDDWFLEPVVAEALLAMSRAGP